MDELVGEAVGRALDEYEASAEGAAADGPLAEYRRYVWRKWLFMAACAVAAVAVMGYAVSYGPMDIGFLECYRIIWEHIAGNV